MNRKGINRITLAILPVLLFSLIALNAYSGDIRGGFYLKLGPSFPMGKYKTGQLAPLGDYGINAHQYFQPAKMGAALDIGFLVYIGPSFAKQKIRAGIDVSFLTFTFNPVTITTAMDGNKYQYWYLYGGQKIGPVITINPVDKLMIDLSYKLNAYVAFNRYLDMSVYTNKWGENLLQNEVSMSLRYSLVVFSVQYNFGKANFNDIDSSKPDLKVENNTLRLLVGLKF